MKSIRWKDFNSFSMKIVLLESNVHYQSDEDDEVV